MRHIHIVLAVVLAFAACNGCDDEPSPTNLTNQQPDGCRDSDGDGYSRGLACVGEADCDDTDVSVFPGAEELCDEVDNNCDNTIDEGCANCSPGDSRPCGLDEGRCVGGTQSCPDGVWSLCEGAEGPFSEECNGEDDDCDGATDENSGVLCSDGISCNGTETCEAGTCMPDPSGLDCTMLDGPCTVGMCSEKDGGCRAFPLENGSPCDDGNFCTDNGSCSAGVCETTPRDCSAEDDACNIGICDETADACVKQPVSDGTSCDDGEFCTVSDACMAGTCGGAVRDCSSAADQCNAGTCDETADACVAQPLADGTGCDDGRYCTVNEACQAGQCAGGGPRSCTAAGGSCRTGTCDEATDTCTGDPVADGTMCDDNLFCTSGETCSAGTCTNGSPTDCTGADGVCLVGTCNETNNVCDSIQATDGATCDDGLFCTVATTCSAGICSGSPRNCAGAADDCNIGTCVEATDQCQPAPRSDGTICEDGLFCTTVDGCVGGTCIRGLDRDCSSAGDQCNLGVCDDAADACVPSAKMDGTLCNDGQFCTAADACSSGACTGGAPLDCYFATGGDMCLAATCNELANRCDVGQSGLCCDTMIDQDLDGYDQCADCDDSNGVVHPGASETCNGHDDDCDGQIDEDFDLDGDGFSTCTSDVALRDCDDANPNANPDTVESCDDGLNTNTGNGIDDDCDGYVDEGCNPCTTTDVDGDGWSECDGDCDDTNPGASPGQVDVCDGLDSDCNVYTTANCDVSDPCNFDGDFDFDNDFDVCGDEMLCGCLLENGVCAGNYRCTSYCNSSRTAPAGDGCGVDATCGARVLRSAAVYGCLKTNDIPGSVLGGGTCTGSYDCRSLDCGVSCSGPTSLCPRICWDQCTNDQECDPGSNCVLFTGTRVTGYCFPKGHAAIGGTLRGNVCSDDDVCDRGVCLTDPNDGSRYCSEACCTDANCSLGYTCSLQGNSVDTSTTTNFASSSSCTTDADCVGEGDLCVNNVCSFRMVETAGQCVRDVAGQGNRFAGQVCTANSDCASNFCERDLGVCIDPCCSDDTCPFGLECQFQDVQTADDRVTNARVCIGISTDELIRHM